MKIGWTEVARLGSEGPGYPHVLIDPHGWCLRLGPGVRSDDKYYSNLPSLLQGLVEHLIRRRLSGAGSIRGLEGFTEEVREAIRRAGELGSELVGRLDMELQPILLERFGRRRTMPGSTRARPGGEALGRSA